jgi:hypothetical protein
MEWILRSHLCRVFHDIEHKSTEVPVPDLQVVEEWCCCVSLSMRVRKWNVMAKEMFKCVRRNPDKYTAGDAALVSRRVGGAAVTAAMIRVSVAMMWRLPRAAYFGTLVRLHMTMPLLRLL